MFGVVICRYTRRWETKQEGPQKGYDNVRCLKLVLLEQRKHGPAADEVGPADPGTVLLAEAVLAGKQKGHG